MLALLALTTLTALAADPAQPATPASAAPDDSAFEGEWVNDKPEVRLVIKRTSAGLHASLVHMGMLAKDGILEGSGATRSGPLEGCGGDFTASSSGLSVALEGPECPVDFNGAFTRLPANHCGPKPTAFTCAAKGGKVLSVCHEPADAFTYAYGKPGAVELSLAAGVFAERALASGLEYTWTFENEGHTYAAYVVESRPQDTGAGVLIEKAGAHVATVSCVGDWYRR